MLPSPRFYDPSQVPSVRIERADVVAEEASAYRAQHRIAPASVDKFRIAAFGIDAQVAFCVPGASLFVPGAVEDTERTIGWLYRHLDRITGLFFSLDTHHAFQIFHPAWWIDSAGDHPAPFTVIGARDVREGRYRAVLHPAESAEYVEKLEASGKYTLTIWPYHALLGGISHALVPSLMEAAMFHALVRGTQTRFEAKGESDLTENYSVLSPEVRELGGRSVGALNSARPSPGRLGPSGPVASGAALRPRELAPPLLQQLLGFDRVYVFGQAKSHCVLSTLRDMKAEIERVDPTLLRKIYVLEDAMSPVPAPPTDPLPPALDFPRVAEAAFSELRAAGMNIVRTSDPIA